MEHIDIYSGIDPREVPTYPLGEAARCAGIHPGTLSKWVHGSRYGTNRSPFKPIIELSDPTNSLLSFFNVVEAYVVAVMRREHGLSLQEIRNALDYIQEAFEGKHPLATKRFKTDGVHLFIEYCNQILNVSRRGQIVFSDIADAYLKRIDWDISGFAERFYPVLIKEKVRDEFKSIVVDPHVSFGRPVLAGTGIPTLVIADRFSAGEKPKRLARVYEKTEEDILEAIRYELRKAA